MPEAIRLTGIEVEGRHGARADERGQPQAFVIDLEIAVEPGEDDLSLTADYEQVVPVVRGLVATESYRLIETLARRIAVVVARMPGALRCRALVRKPAAAERLGIREVLAEAEAERE